MLKIFILLQLILFFIMILHDWLPILPFNNVADLKKHDSNKKRFIGSLINGVAVLIPLILTLIYYPNYSASTVNTIICFYLLITVGTIVSWWIPYIFGSSKSHKEAFLKFQNTHHFLPKIKDHVVPNTLHVILHLFVWSCLAIAILMKLS